jgi:hypothetical protein
VRRDNNAAHVRNSRSELAKHGSLFFSTPILSVLAHFFILYVEPCYTLHSSHKFREGGSLKLTSTRSSKVILCMVLLKLLCFMSMHKKQQQCAQTAQTSNINTIVWASCYSPSGMSAAAWVPCFGKTPKALV